MDARVESAHDDLMRMTRYVHPMATSRSTTKERLYRLAVWSSPWTQVATVFDDLDSRGR
jgi:hypothetical protein